MIIVLLSRHRGAFDSIGDCLEKVKKDRQLDDGNCVEFSSYIDSYHPEEKRYRISEEIVKKYNYPVSQVKFTKLEHAIILTSDALIVDLFNLELLKNGKLHLEAFEIIPKKTDEDMATLRPALKRGQIDVTIVNHVRQSLDQELKKLRGKK